MEDWELEHLRRSVAMLPPGHSAGPLSKEQVRDLIGELETARKESSRYRQVVGQLRKVLEALDGV